MHNVIKKYDIKVLNEYVEKGLLRKQKHSSLPLIIWNYTNDCQYSGQWDEITLSCRGLVTDIAGKVISRPLSKFFNRSENKHTETEVFTAYEKLDGWLGTLFWYRNQWVGTTRGSFDNEVCNWFNEKLKKDHSADLDILYKEYTYMFELIHPLTKIVVDYNSIEEIFLLASRNIETGEEEDLSNLTCTSFKQTPRVEVTDLDSFAKLADQNREGIVIKFSNGERCKIKLEEYFRLSSIMSGCTQRNVWNILKNKQDIKHLMDNVPDEFRKWVEQTVEELYFEYDRIFSNMVSLYTMLSSKYGHNSEKLSANINFLAKFDRSIVMALLNHRYDVVEQLIWEEIKPDAHLYAKVN